MARSMLFCIVAIVLAALWADQGSCEKQSAYIDAAKNFHLTWELDSKKTENITFEVTVKTRGFVGFGLAPKASMIGADLIIGGVKDDKPYFQDRYSNSTSEPMVDAHQNWILLEAKENETHTYLKFWRALDTCDDQDLVISADTVNLIWSYGDSDDISYHGEQTRGGRQFNLFDPPEPEFDTSKLVKWEVRVNDTMLSDQTTYLCTIHQLAKFDTPHQMIALEAYLGDENAVRHTHHFTALACNLDEPEVLETLKKLHGTPGSNCYEGDYKKIKSKCNNILFGWAVGGKRIVLPENVGVPIGADDGSQEDQYIMFEVHYDNPSNRENVRFESGFNLYFTNETRKDEGSVLMIGTEILPSLFIPPNTEEFTLSGHCSSEYTRAFLPKDGIKVVSVNMHSHLSGRRLRVRHYRDGVELPWLLSDDHYDFDYQQTRLLPKEITILPGDQITMECVMQTLGRDNITIAGESTREEMCHVFLFYYPKIDLLACRSFYPIEKLFAQFGIMDYEKTDDLLEMLNPKITKPAKMAGKKFSDIANAKEYSPRFVKQLQNELRYGKHVSTFAMSDISSNSLIKNGAKYNVTSYPEKVREFALPLSTCRANGNSGNSGNNSSSSIAASIVVVFAALLSVCSFYKLL